MSLAPKAAPRLPRLPLPPPLRADVPGTWAFDTMSRRVRDEILGREVLGANAAALAVLPAARKSLEELARELGSAAGSTPLRHLRDGAWAPDADAWRGLLEPSVSRGETWLSAPWCLAEFYLYRRVMESLEFFPAPPQSSLATADACGDPADNAPGSSSSAPTSSLSASTSSSSPLAAAQKPRPQAPRLADPFAGSKRRGLEGAVGPLELLAPRFLQALESCSSSGGDDACTINPSASAESVAAATFVSALETTPASRSSGRSSSFRASLRLFTMASLWGNRMDLSLWPSGSDGDRSGGFPAAVLGSSGAGNSVGTVGGGSEGGSAGAASTTATAIADVNWDPDRLLLADDFLLLEAACEALRARNSPGKGGVSGVSGASTRVDVIVDNAGLELVADLCLADFLVSAGVASQVVFQLKGHPTFVSDATAADVRETVRCLGGLDPAAYPGCVALAKRWRAHLGPKGSWLLREDLFWAQPFAFWEMPRRLLEGEAGLGVEGDGTSGDASGCCNDGGSGGGGGGGGGDESKALDPCHLAFTKGDANYRRLLGDRAWAWEAPFTDVVSYLPHVTVCALRTLKSELGCGMAKDATARAAAEDPAWMVSGRFGVIQVAPAADLDAFTSMTPAMAR